MTQVTNTTCICRHVYNPCVLTCVHMCASSPSPSRASCLITNLSPNAPTLLLFPPILCIGEQWPRHTWVFQEVAHPGRKGCNDLASRQLW